MAYLINYIDAIVELLPLKNWMEVKQPVFEVLITISKRDNHGYFLQCSAVLWGIAASFPDFWIVFFHQLQVHSLRELHMQWAN